VTVAVGTGLDGLHVATVETVTFDFDSRQGCKWDGTRENIFFLSQSRPIPGVFVPSHPMDNISFVFFQKCFKNGESHLHYNTQ